MKNSIIQAPHSAESLYEVLINDKITLEDARRLYYMAAREELLKNYHFPQKPNKDGYFRIYVKDITKKSGRRQLFAKDLETLRDLVYDYEKGTKRRLHRTFADVFEIYLDESLRMTKDPEKKISAKNTANRTKSEYRRFIGNTAFADCFIEDITKNEIDQIIRMNLERHNLRRKGLSSLLAILRQTFAFAYEQEWIEENPFERILAKRYFKMVLADVPIEMRTHDEETVQRILDALRDYHRRKPGYIPAYALEFQILTGMRRGEIPPLQWSDFTDDYFVIHREQLSDRVNGKETFSIVSHTKTYKARHFPIGTDLKYLLERLWDVHETYYPNSVFLFPADTKNGVITNNTVYELYRRICKKLGIPISRDFIKGTHSFRRNAITDVINATNGNIVLAAEMFGNSPAVINKHYLTAVELDAGREALNQRKLG